uniref:Uncharacterized protein n=1 Tax=Arundo donax TaxID=35708 RepID=A0A0A9CIZ8_ARUDO
MGGVGLLDGSLTAGSDLLL